MRFADDDRVETPIRVSEGVGTESRAAATAALRHVPVLGANRAGDRVRKTGRRSGAHPETDAGGSVTTRGAPAYLPGWDYASFSSRQPPGWGW